MIDWRLAPRCTMKVSGSSEPSGGTSRYLAREAVVGLQPFDDLLAGEPLGDRHLVGDRLALGDDVDHLPHAGRLRDQVVAGLELHRAGRPLPSRITWTTDSPQRTGAGRQRPLRARAARQSRARLRPWGSRPPCFEQAGPAPRSCSAGKPPTRRPDSMTSRRSVNTPLRKRTTGRGGPRSRLKRWRRCRATGRVGSSRLCGAARHAPRYGRPL